MKKTLALILALATSVLAAQQPQTQTAPIFPVNAKYTNGVAPGYAPTAGSGLVLNLGAGTANCSGTIVSQAAGTLTMTASTTNYVYLDTASGCIPAVKTSAFTSVDMPIAVVVAGGSAISSIADVRTMFQQTMGTGGPRVGGTPSTNAIQKGIGGGNIGDSSITDDGTSVSTPEPVTALGFSSSDTSQNGYRDLTSQGTLPGAPPTSTVRMTVPNSVTAYGFEMPGVAPSGTNTYLSCAPPSGGWSVCTWTTVTGSGTGFLVCADTSASGTAQSCTTSPSFTPTANQCVVYTTTTANSGAGLTLNVNSLGAKSVAKWQGVTTLAAGDVAANEPALACYDGTRWNLSTIGNAPSSGGGGAWSGLSVPTTNLSLAMAAFTTTFTYNAATGTSDLFKLTDTASNTGTGILAHFTTASGSTEIPWQADANGVGWRVNASGALEAVGSGSTAYGAIFPEGTAMTPTAGKVMINSNSTSHTLDISMNGSAFSSICTPLNGLCSVPAGVPATVSNLVYWFSADRNPTINSGAFLKWFDNTTSSWASSVASNGATYLTGQINGQPAVSFPNSSVGQYLITVPFALHATSVFVVFNPAGFAAIQDFLSGPNGAYSLVITTAGKLNITKTFVSSIATDTTVLSTGAWVQANATYNDSTGAYAFRVARAASSSGTNAVAFSTFSDGLGYNHAGNNENFNGLIAEIIVYNRVLSSGEITTIETYLHGKYGI